VVTNNQPITACKQYCIAAGATQGNITYTQNVIAQCKKPTRKWHIWFFPTLKPTLKKPKEPFFCQRTDEHTDRQIDNYSNILYIEKRDIQKYKLNL
jgi:hypothetical protein